MSEKIDILNRQPFVDNLIDLINIIAQSGKGCTFSLDGKWGSGKSYVLEMFEKQISLYQNQDTAQDKYIVFHYNCWQYDFYEEPAIAIVAAIRNEIEKYNKVLPDLSPTLQAAFSVVGDIGKDLLRNFLQTKIGFDPFEIYNKIRNGISDIENTRDEIIAESIASNDYDTYYKFKEILDSTKKQLATLAAEKPVILVVDELDRCMPSYAIKVLERLHHLFDEDSNIIVILAVDKAQLERTIHQIFGTGEDETDDTMCADYLRKFINFSISLNTGIISDSFWTRYDYILKNYDISDDKAELYLELPNRLFEGLDIRSQERIMDQIQTLHALTFDNNNSSAVLYFELIYAAIKARVPSLNFFNWLANINSQENTSVKSVIGTELWEYLKELNSKVFPHNQKIISGRDEYKILYDIPMGIVFWMFASLNEKTTTSPNRCGYQLNGFEKYNELVSQAIKYHTLANIIQS